MNIKYNKEELENLIFNEKLSYQEIGKRYSCSDANIKKVAKQLGIILLPRRKTNPYETFGKGSGIKRYCKHCSVLLENYCKSFCSTKCQVDFNYTDFIVQWKQGNKTGLKGEGQISDHIKRYFLEKHNYKCSHCEWNKVHPITNIVPLQLHHIDGDHLNNNEDNLELLCPNCHVLTENFGSLNKVGTRAYRRKLNPV